MPNNLAPPRPSLTEGRSQSIRLRRPISSAKVQLSTVAEGNRANNADSTNELIGRPRSSSAPRGADAEDDGASEGPSDTAGAAHMASVAEEGQTPGGTTTSPLEHAKTEGGGRPRGSTIESRSAKAKRRKLDRAETYQNNEYDAKVIDFLDVVDPEVSTLSTLTNVQNSLFVPDLGRFLNRMPTYELTRRPTTRVPDQKGADTAMRQKVTRQQTKRAPSYDPETAEFDEAARNALEQKASINSVLSDSRFAVLPHGASLEGWSEEDKEMLNDHVRHLLHSRREKLKRVMKGFRQYLRKPLGLFVTIYAFLITVFGLIWVLFLIGWISGGDRHSYDINVIDNVLVALFAIIGDGLAPFRVVDTYHMIFIAHYHHLTWKLRNKKALPELPDPNDLPLQTILTHDVEASISKDPLVSVLSRKQQDKLIHHAAKFSKSHTYYKPHETETHFAFPVNYLIAITTLLDLHSCFQIALGACTWGISYHTRPQALTAIILCFSIACNTTAGILITVADRKTRKKDVLETMFRQALTEEAMAKIQSAHQKAEEQEMH